MRRFNRGYALIFLFMIVVALVAIRYVHQQVDGRYQAEMSQYTEYGLDDWIDVLGLEEFLGDPPVTPFPADQIPIAPTDTPTPPDEEGSGT
jgi:hypothetical protein